MIRKNTISFNAKRIVRLVVCLLLAALMLPASAYAAQGQKRKASVDPIGQGDNYSAVLYNNTNGLPTSEANDIAQTEEGFIWIGCYSGLIRYDGSSFERIDSAAGFGGVKYLHVDSRNRLWIGTNDAGLAMMEQGEFRLWGVDDGIGSSKICCIEEDENGTIYVGTTEGITMISPDLNLQYLDDPRIAGAYTSQIHLGGDGLLYCVTNEGDYFTLRSGELVDYTAHDSISIQGIICIFPDLESPDDMYIGTESFLFYHGNLNGDPDSLEKIDLSPLASVIDIEQIGDQIWVCARNGIGVLDSQGFHCLSDLPMYNSIVHMMMDYEGNLWFTSDRQGVMKLVPNRFTDLYKQLGLPQNVVNATCMYQGNLFIGTDTGLMVADGKNVVSSVPLASVKTASGEELPTSDLLKLLDGCRIRSIIHDSQDRLWISTWQGCGLLRYDRGRVTIFDESGGLLSNNIRAVSETPDGSIAVACTGGANIIKGDRVIAAFSEEDGISNQATLTVCAAPNGDILLGSNGGGIYIITRDGTRCIGTKDGLNSGIVMRIKYDPDNRLYWIVTSNSIAYMTEDYQVTTIQNFPYSNNYDLYKNSKGDMWILSSNGIYVVPVEELIANGDIQPVHYDMANGLSHIPTGNSYSELTPEGDLYIAGNSGVSRINIESSLENISEIKQAVPYVDADGKRLYSDENCGFTIPSETQKLTVYGFVFDYSLTDPKVSFQLEGFDRKEVTVRRSDLDPVIYTNLPGGSYHFVMELKDAMGRGSKILSVPIVKEKALYEQVWFYIVSGLTAALVIAWGVHLYIRKKAREMEIRHREVMEKERLTTELHTAGRIQASMLPQQFPPFPDRSEFDIYATMAPAREVGGDFYDFFLIDEDHLCLVIADVSGKGIPAALFMMTSKVILNNYAMIGKSPAEVLTMTNEAICSNNKTDMFITVWMGILEISTGRILAANAGHEYPALMKNGTFALLKDPHGLVIGGLEDIRYKDYELSLNPGDKLFVYTDGVPEATAAGDQMFGTGRMVEALNTDPKAAPEQILKNVRSAVDSFVKDAVQFDDLTMLCLEYKGSQE